MKFQTKDYRMLGDFSYIGDVPITRHHKPKIAFIDGEATTTSMAIAEAFRKNHFDVMKAVRRHLADLPERYHKRNFALMVREVPIGSGATRKDPYYRMTKNGFAFVVMSFTGKEAALWKVAYIEMFDRMANHLINEERRQLQNRPVGRVMNDGMDSPLFNELMRAFDKRVSQAVLMTHLIDAGAAQHTIIRSINEIATALNGRISRSAIQSATRRLVERGVLTYHINRKGYYRVNLPKLLERFEALKLDVRVISFEQSLTLNAVYQKRYEEAGLLKSQNPELPTGSTV
jgi:Rha family phage regulatory protein